MSSLSLIPKGISKLLQWQIPLHSVPLTQTKESETSEIKDESILHKKYTKVIKYKSHTFHPLEISIIITWCVWPHFHRKPWWKLMYVGLTQAGPEKPGQPCTHTALLHKIEGKEQKKKSGIFQGTNCEFLFKTQKNKEKVFIAKSFFPFSTCTSLSPPIQ